ncbi:winged helix-turn-helix domain-containing protein [Vibrio sp. SS-MA-C1-2]|uniref:winged helix-turn-helix domain-containing protein n=1 Tax=Vibrio sp. SS-MA-C1-2 TaxID=2908646 RepID=UPI001F1BC820|nr:winged helix-turn-helix domain-containing protein [Vibrio sp. SS-MA-C1-2]UJF18795.1 winged helix-turn-helix domain-containing protein [Vibrio sp. SS-MA-C1-2]
MNDGIISTKFIELQSDCKGRVHCVGCKGLDYDFIKESGIEVTVAEKDIMLTIVGSSRTMKCSLYAIRALCLLTNSINRPVSKEELTTHIWNRSIVSSSSLPVLISELRALIRSSKFSLITIRKYGYVMSIEQD